MLHLRGPFSDSGVTFKERNQQSFRFVIRRSYKGACLLYRLPEFTSTLILTYWCRCCILGLALYKGRVLPWGVRRHKILWQARLWQIFVMVSQPPCQEPPQPSRALQSPLKFKAIKILLLVPGHWAVVIERPSVSGSSRSSSPGFWFGGLRKVLAQ